MTAFHKLVRAHIRGFVRDRTAFFWTFFFPTMFVLLFGFFFGRGNQSPPRFAVGVVIEHPEAQAFLEALRQVPIIDVETGSRAAELKALKNGKRRAVVVPGGADLEVHYDGSQPQVWMALRSVLQSVAYSMRGVPPIPFREVSIQDAGRSSSNSSSALGTVIPGIIAMSIMQLGLFSAIPLVREREQGILKRVGATPLPRQTYLVSHLLFRVLIGLVQTAILFGMAALIFGLRIQGSPWLLAVFIVLGALTFMMFGGIIGSVTRTTESAMPLVQIFNIGLMFLSTVFFPLEMFPRWTQTMVRSVPTSFLAEALRGITQNTAAGTDLARIAAFLGVWMVVGLVVATKSFRWE